MTELGVILTGVGIVLSVFLWIYGPGEALAALKRLLRRVDAVAIQKLTTSGLIIDEPAILQSQTRLRHRRRVFWPVVPGVSPNLIHATFVRVVRSLEAAGLEVTVFVFDEYYAGISGRGQPAASEVARGFVDMLHTMGLPHRGRKVLYQSSAGRGKKVASTVFPSFLNYLGVLSTGEVIGLAKAKAYWSVDTKFARVVKPVLNMAYLLSVGRGVGFTLSGADERALWKCYGRVARRYGLQEPCRLCIPVMEGVGGQATHVLDEEGNIRATDSLDVIGTRVRRGLAEGGDDSAIWYALRYITFAAGREVVVRGTSGHDIVLRDVDGMKDALRSGHVDLEGLSGAVAEEMRAILTGDIYR